MHVAKKQQRFGLRHKNYECSVEAFIERLTQHIPEKFFKMIRYYGFLANRVRKTLLPKVYDLLDQTIEAAQSVAYSGTVAKNLDLSRV
ncbi:Putative transposase (plasmid) [Piscirickettsia salmonis]|nr:Putative transposase [Piscirickettsia salmonis]